MRTRMTYGPTNEEFNTSNLPEQKTAPVAPLTQTERITYTPPTGGDVEPARVEVVPGGGNVSPEVQTEQKPEMMTLNEVLGGSTDQIKQYYNRVRAEESPELAQEIGMEIHKRLYPQFYKT